MLTYLVSPDDSALDHYPLLGNALAFWRSTIQQRQPFCPACRASFAEEAQPAAFLFATAAIAPTSASVSAFCMACWNDLPPAMIEREATRVLQQVIPGGRFLDPCEARR
ncbi:hypothetical protein [Bradyrhizobium sp. CCBAU 051011]|uniref:hypothetical protein n=1 Tax=Bradyrhizobium sp. CCBAU 051011 TaxID=858422 RepID=UPI00137969F0|nr:hypothetical protein [Bradyrhizobium sp. CCBAU 051011]